MASSTALEAKLPFAVHGAVGINVPKVAPTPSKLAASVTASTSSLSPNATGEHMLGTSIMAVAFPGGVVLGADSRTSTGSYVANRVSDKLTPCHDLIYCCRSGSAADTQAIGDMVQYYTDLHALETGTLPLVKSVATMFADVIYNNKDRLMAGVIVAGWDKKDGGSVYSIPLGGALVRQQFAIGGSGSTYIYGFCDSQWAEYQKRPGGVTEATAQEFVRRALAHAMARDGSSGGVIRMVTISEAGVKRTMIPGDKLDFYGDFEEGPQSTT